MGSHADSTSTKLVCMLSPKAHKFWLYEPRAEVVVGQVTGVRDRLQVREVVGLGVVYCLGRFHAVQTDAASRSAAYYEPYGLVLCVFAGQVVHQSPHSHHERRRGRHLAGQVRGQP